MVEAFEFSIWAQAIFCTTAIILNSTLAFVIFKSNRQDVGFYKWMLIGYATFEIVYSVVVLQAMPIHVVYSHTWIFFSFRGPLIGTPVAFLSSAMYCLFYEIWMLLVVNNFLYRYISVCRPDVSDYIKHHSYCRWLLFGLFLLLLGICLYCTIYLCAVNKISPEMEHKIKDEFKLDNIKNIGYTMLRLFDLQGHVSYSGIFATFIHVAIVSASVSTVTFCSLKIWWKIKQMQKMTEETNVKMEKQLFRTLMIQIIVPVLLCHIPSVAHLTFAFWQDFPLDCLTPFFSVFTTIPKALDPIIAFVCIAEYRNTLRRIMGCKPKAVYSTTHATAYSVSQIRRETHAELMAI